MYAAPFGAAMALSIPQQNAHLYMVAGAVAPALYALYRVGCFQLPVVDLLYTPTSEVLMVRLGELDKQGRLEEGVEAFREAAGKLAFVFLPFAAFLFAAAPEFIGALFGAKFLPAVPVFRVSVLGVVLAILPMDGVLRARGHTRAIFLSYLLKAVVTVPLVWVGVKQFGMMGGIGVLGARRGGGQGLAAGAGARGPVHPEPDAAACATSSPGGSWARRRSRPWPPRAGVFALRLGLEHDRGAACPRASSGGCCRSRWRACSSPWGTWACCTPRACGPWGCSPPCARAAPRE